jgi:hypothetical protein
VRPISVMVGSTSTMGSCRRAAANRRVSKKDFGDLEASRHPLWQKVEDFFIVHFWASYKNESVFDVRLDVKLRVSNDLKSGKKLHLFWTRRATCGC